MRLRAIPRQFVKRAGDYHGHPCELGQNFLCFGRVLEIILLFGEISTEWKGVEKGDPFSFDLPFGVRDSGS